MIVLIIWTGLCSSYEGTTRGDTSRFRSFTARLAKYIEVVKTPEGFLPNPLPSKIMAFFLYQFMLFPYKLKITNYLGVNKNLLERSWVLDVDRPATRV